MDEVFRELNYISVHIDDVLVAAEPAPERLVH